MRTFVSNTSSAVPVTEDIFAKAELRAFTRAAFDGDTETCVPLKADGSVDDTVWEIHKEATAAARADRARAIDATISAVQKIAQAVK